MSVPTSQAILDLEARAKNFTPLAADHPPSCFLSLAPATSSSYPVASSSSSPTQSPRSSLPDITAVPLPAPAPSRRTPSASSGSDEKTRTTFRFLKLGPVHNGDHGDGHNEDWYDVAVE